LKETKEIKLMLGKLKASQILRWSSLAPRTLETLRRLYVMLKLVESKGEVLWHQGL